MGYENQQSGYPCPATNTLLPYFGGNGKVFMLKWVRRI
jgi:hypothetical protein